VYLPYQAAHFLWLVAIQLFLLAGIWLFMRLVNWPESVNGKIVFLLLAILFLPNLQNTIWGQFNTIAPFFLALCYWALLRDKYFWAGIWLVGLTFKPQGMLLTLAFILVWVLFKRERRPLLAGFALACVLLWGFAELFEPGWVGNFLGGLIKYSRFHAPPSAIDLLGLPATVVEGLLLVGAAALFYRARHSSPDAPLFRGGLALEPGYLVAGDTGFGDDASGGLTRSLDPVVPEPQIHTASALSLGCVSFCCFVYFGIGGLHLWAFQPRALWITHLAG
jgi:hypothetical protein